MPTHGLTNIGGAEDQKHVGLNEDYQELECIKNAHQRYRQDQYQKATGSGSLQDHDASVGEQLNHDVAGKNVCEQPHAEGYWAEDIGNQLDGKDDRKDGPRRSFGDQRPDHANAMAAEREQVGVDEHQQRQARRHDEVAGEGELDRRKCDHRAESNDDKDGAQQGNGLLCLIAAVLNNGSDDELVENLSAGCRRPGLNCRLRIANRR